MKETPKNPTYDEGGVLDLLEVPLNDQGGLKKAVFCLDNGNVDP